MDGVEGFPAVFGIIQHDDAVGLVRQALNMFHEIRVCSPFVPSDASMGSASDRRSEGANQALGRGSAYVSAHHPVFVRTGLGSLGVATAGRILNAGTLRGDVVDDGGMFFSSSDAELLAHLIARSPQKNMVSRVVDAMWKVDSVLSAVLLAEEQLIGVRGARGTVPLVLGRLRSSYVLSSEPQLLTRLGGELLFALEPGELVIVGREGVQRVQPLPNKPKALCSLSPIALLPPDGGAFGFWTGDLRRQIGRELASHHGVVGDLVCNPPGFDALAEGFAQHSGLPQRRVFVDHRPPWPIDRALVAGQKVVLVAPLLALTGTVPVMVARLRGAKATEVHLRLATPPMEEGCRFGVRTPSLKPLAELHLLEQQLGVDSLAYLTLDSLAEIMGRGKWCQACFGGAAPIRVERSDDQLLLFQSGG